MTNKQQVGDRVTEHINRVTISGFVKFGPDKIGNDAEKYGAQFKLANRLKFFDRDQYVAIKTFNPSVRDELLKLKEGDYVTVKGTLRFSNYKKKDADGRDTGEWIPSNFVDPYAVEVSTPEPVSDATSEEMLASIGASSSVGADDDIPF